MKHLFFICLALLGLLTGCSPKPTDAEISAVLLQNLPESLKTASTLESVQTELNAAGDEVLVKFKSVIKLSQPLFEKVEFIAAAQVSGFDTSSYKAIDKGINELSANARETLAELAKQDTDKPTMLKEVAASGSNSDWYGSFRFKKVVDKWVASDFKTDIEPKFTGKFRSSFDVAAIESSQAAAWFSDVKAKQQSLLEKIAIASQLDQKDAEIAATKESAQRDLKQKDLEVNVARESAQRDLKQKELEVNVAREMAQRERDARERMIASQQQQARKMPIDWQIRKAAIACGYVLQLQSNQPITVRLDVMRTA